MFLTILLVTLLTVSAVSAADNATENIAGVEETTDEVVSVNENQTISEDDVLRDSPGTFTDLAREIANAKNTLNLNRNYSYDFDYDYKDGIIIDKSIVINGNGYTINGNNQARAFYITASDVVLNNINFANLRCHSGQSSYYDMYDGGAILWEGEGTISNCNFVNCISERRGGAISWDSENGTLYGCSFVNCLADDMGGAIDAYGTVYDCSFVDCSSTDGGAVTGLGPDGVLRDCSFVNCSADSAGGAVWWFGDNGIISNCIFTDCSATDGGAIRWGGEKSSISDCYFMNCYASGTGGAIYSWNIDNAVLSGCIFTDCHADSGSGAVYWDGNDGVLSDCSFIDCSADGRAGAVRWSASFEWILWDSRYGVLRDCSFIDCSAGGNAGAVLWQGSYGSLSNCSFIDCSAGENGGAVYWGGYDGSVDSIFKKCQATNSGGGIYFAASYCSLINSTFKGNDAQNGPNWYSTETLNVINVTTSKISTVLNAPDVSIAYGDSKKLIVTLTDEDNDLIAGEKISIVLNNKEQTLTTNSKGQVSLAIPTNLAPKTYVATITYAGNEEYAPSTATADVVVNKAGTVISAVYNANNNEVVATLTNANTGKAIGSANVNFNLNGATATAKTNSKGQAKFSTVGLSSGTTKISYAGNSKYKSTSTSIAIAVKSDIIISAVYDSDNNELVATLTNGDTGKAVSSATVQVDINGKTTAVKTDTKGKATISTVGLPLGTNTATISYAGNSKYNAASTSISFNVKTKVIVTDVYAYSDRIVAKLTNGATGKTIANANMIVEINGVKYNAKSDNKGQLTFDTTGLDLPSAYDLTISYRGNDRYTASSATVAVDLNKANMMITTNYHADKQKMVATLKNSKTGKVVSNANMVIELNGVKTTYKSNDQGKITLPTADFAPGTYVGTVTYPGNARYNSISAVFKVDI